MVARTLAPVLVAAILGACWETSPAAGTGKPKPKPDDQVVRYVGAQKGTAWGRPVLKLLLAQRYGRGVATVVVPSKDPMARKYNPSQTVVDVVKDLKRGDLVEISTAKFRGFTMLRSIRRYHPKPGEDDPDAFIFVKHLTQKVSGRDYMAVALKKRTRVQTILVPNRKNDDGKWVPDEKIAAQVKKLEADQIVEITIEKTAGRLYLKSIRPYQPPVKGSFVKLIAKKKVGEQECAAIVVKVDGSEREILIPNRKARGDKVVPDRKLLAAVKKLKADQPVECKTVEEDGQTWLARVKALKKPPAPKPKPKPLPAG